MSQYVDQSQVQKLNLVKNDTSDTDSNNEDNYDEISCRMYAHKLPQKGELVMCQVTEVGDSGSYVKLLEFNNIQGMIGITEYSRKHIRSISKLMNVNKIIAAEVINVDASGRYVDLSKKTLDAVDIHYCENKYHKSKKIHSIVRRAATLLFPTKNVSDAMIYIYEIISKKIQLNYIYICYPSSHIKKYKKL